MMTTIMVLIVLKVCVSACVVRMARHFKWNMLYVVPVMAALWVPIIYMLARECM